MTLYPIVQIVDGISGGPVVMWHRQHWYADRKIADVSAREWGVYAQTGDYLDSDEKVAQFCEAVREAWDAVRAIRHGTSLERFPRDLTAVSEPTSADL